MDPNPNDPETSVAALIEDLRSVLQDDSATLADDVVLASWRHRLQGTMRDAPALKPQLGAALGDLMRESKRWANRTDYQWVSVGYGRLAIGHRPRRKAIEGMPASGVTHVVTLLCETEGAPAIGADVARAGVKWIWLPLENGEPPPAEKMTDIQTGFTKIRAALEEGGSLYLHCSAGIHRTGMISYALLGSMGRTEGESLDLLGELRTVTSEGVGDHRIAWGNQFGD